nr:MAG TPA: hypothetical protein [Caudoviricetes sp.]
MQENSKRIIIRDRAEVAGFFDVFTSYASVYLLVF